MPQSQKIPADVLKLIKISVEEKIPFNKVLGITVKSFENNSFCLEIKNRAELVGNYVHGILHGGVISATLDVVGGFTAFLSVISQMESTCIEEKMAKFSRVGTIDIRVDYLRPGRGKYFLATGYLLRTGNKVSVTRMEFHNDENTLIAVGTGSYMIG